MTYILPKIIFFVFSYILNIICFKVVKGIYQVIMILLILKNNNQVRQIESLDKSVLYQNKHILFRAFAIYAQQISFSTFLLILRFSIFFRSLHLVLIHFGLYILLILVLALCIKNLLLVFCFKNILMHFPSYHSDNYPLISHKTCKQQQSKLLRVKFTFQNNVR